MQTFILKIDEQYVPSLLDLIKPIPKDSFDIKRIDLYVDDNINSFEDEIAYQSALLDLNVGAAITIDEYITQRALA